MSTGLSDADAFLVALPMLFFGLIAFFRLDELLSRPKKQPEDEKQPGHGRRLCNWDKDGVPVCTDPEWTMHAIARRKYSESPRINSKPGC